MFQFSEIFALGSVAKPRIIENEMYSPETRRFWSTSSVFIQFSPRRNIVIKSVRCFCGPRHGYSYWFRRVSMKLRSHRWLSFTRASELTRKQFVVFAGFCFPLSPRDRRKKIVNKKWVSLPKKMSHEKDACVTKVILAEISNSHVQRAHAAKESRIAAVKNGLRNCSNYSPGRRRDWSSRSHSLSSALFAVRFVMRLNKTMGVLGLREKILPHFNPFHAKKISRFTWPLTTNFSPLRVIAGQRFI